MTIIDLLELNIRLIKENQFSLNQWKEIIIESFSHGNEWSFDWAVELFYTELLNIDYEDCKNLITDIQSGNEDAIDRFSDDIFTYIEEMNNKNN